METLTPMELVLAAQTGDRAAFEMLVQPYQRELLVHCYRMVGSFHDAEDLVQETLLRAWEKRSTFSYPESYRAWLYRIATNLCLNVLKRNKKRSLPPSTVPNPTVVDDWRWHFGACSGRAERKPDGHVARMTRPGGRQRRETVWLPDERKAAGFRQR